MNADIQSRLRELREELAAGEAQMEALDRRRAQLRDTMLRISGAIQVLEELSAVAATQATTAEPAPPAPHGTLS